MLEEFVQSALMSGGKEARAAYVKAGAVLLSKLWQKAAPSEAFHQLHRLPPGLLYQVRSILIMLVKLAAFCFCCSSPFSGWFSIMLSLLNKDGKT